MSQLATVSLAFLFLLPPGGDRIEQQVTPETPKISGSEPVGLSSVNRGSRLADRYAVPRTLDRDAIAEGFLGVSMSVSQCMSRHMKRAGESPAPRVEVRVTVARDGKVSRMRLPRRVRRTVFGTCMRAHSSRWRFPPFTGRPIQVKKQFVLR